MGKARAAGGGNTQRLVREFNRDNGHGGDANKADCYAQIRVDGKVDARYAALLERGGLRRDGDRQIKPKSNKGPLSVQPLR